MAAAIRKDRNPVHLTAMAAPLLWRVSLPAKAMISFFTFTTTVSMPGLGQPSVSYTLSTYEVVLLGQASGLKMVGSLKVLTGLQKAVPYHTGMYAGRILITNKRIGARHGCRVWDGAHGSTHLRQNIYRYALPHDMWYSMQDALWAV